MVAIFDCWAENYHEEVACSGYLSELQGTHGGAVVPQPAVASRSAARCAVCCLSHGWRLSPLAIWNRGSCGMFDHRQHKSAPFQCAACIRCSCRPHSGARAG